MRLRHFRAFRQAPGQSKFIATTAGTHNCEGNRRSSSDEELLLKLRSILLGSTGAAAGAAAELKKHVKNNAGLLSRLKEILVQEQQEELSVDSEPREDDASAVLYALGKQGKVAAARALCQEMAQKGCIPDLVSLSSLCGHAAELEPLFQLPKGWDSDVSLNTGTMIALCKAGKFLEAQRAVTAMLKQGMEVDTLVLNTLMYGLCKAGHELQCFALIQDMVARGLSPDLLHDGVALANRACAALDTLLEKGACPDVVFYSALVDGLCKVGRVPEAFYLFKFLRSRIVFSASTCNALVEGVCKLGMNGEACQIAKVMAKQGLLADNTTFESMLNRLCQDGQEELALKLVRGNTVPVDYHSVLQELCNAGKLLKATELLVDIQQTDRIRDVETFNRLLSLLCEALVEKKAYDLLETMTENLKLHCTSTYSILINALCNAGKLEDAHRLLKLMPEEGCPRDSRAFTPLISKLCEKNLPQDAWVLLHEMTDEDYNASCRVSNMVLEAFYKAGNLEEAMMVLNWMLGKGFTADAAAYDALVQGSCKTGNVEQAVMLYNEMFQRGCKPDLDTYNALLAGLWGSGKTKEGLLLFQQMIRKSMIPDATTCSIIINGLCKEQKIDVAFKVLQLSPGLGCFLGPESYRAVLEALCQRGDIPRARVLLKEMVFRGHEPDVESCEMVFLRWEESSGTDTEMEEFFKDMLSRNISPTDSISRAVLTRLCAAGKLEAASDIILKMNLLKLDVDGSIYRPYLVSLCKSGRVEEARSLCEGDMRGKCTPATFLAAALEAGLVSEAHDYYTGLLEQGHEVTSVLVQLVSGLTGKVSAACRFIREVMWRGNNEFLVTKLVDELLKAGKLLEAREVFVEMTAANIIPCTDESRATLKRVLDALVRGKQAVEACKLLDGVLPLEDLCSQELCRRLIYRLLQAKQTGSAYNALEATVRSRPLPGLLNSILADFCKLRKFEEAASALEALHGKGLLRPAAVKSAEV